LDPVSPTRLLQPRRQERVRRYGSRYEARTKIRRRRESDNRRDRSSSGRQELATGDPMTDVDNILASLHEHDQSAQGYGHSLRLDFSRLVVESIDRLGWSQRQLARSSGLRESYISRIVHGEANFTLDTVGAVLHALGVRPLLVGESATVSTKSDSRIDTPEFVESTNGKVITSYQASVTTVVQQPEFTIIATGDPGRNRFTNPRQRVRRPGTGNLGGFNAAIASAGPAGSVPGIRLRDPRSPRADRSLSPQHVR